MKFYVLGHDSFIKERFIKIEPRERVGRKFSSPRDWKFLSVLPFIFFPVGRFNENYSIVEWGHDSFIISQNVLKIIIVEAAFLPSLDHGSS